MAPSLPIPMTLPQEYGYVLLTALASCGVGIWHGSQVGSARKAAGIPYPNAYASAEAAKADPQKYRFNCTQRAHANYLEHQPQFLVGLLVAGLRYPLVASGLGLIWSACRVAYGIGYVNPDKEAGKGRYAGIGFLPAEFGLLGTGLFAAYQMAMGN